MLNIEQEPQHRSYYTAAGVWMAYCMIAYIFVMYSMGKMLQSAISESADSSQRQGLLFIYYGTVVIWSTFVVVWFGQEFGVLSIYNAEMGNMLANFAAKVRAFVSLLTHAACKAKLEVYTVHTPLSLHRVASLSVILHK